MLKEFSKPITEIALLITFYGAFNPLIFDKTWFAKNKLIGELEAEKLDVKFLSERGVSIGFDFCDFSVDKERFFFKIEQMAFLSQTVDLIKGVLFNLKTIAIDGAEFGVYPHLDFREEEETDKFFNKVSPNSFWDNYVSSSKLDKIVVKQNRKEKHAYELNINISRCPKSEKLIHFFLDDIFSYKEDSLNAKDVNEFLDEALIKSFNHSIDIINKLTDVS